ncbi:MAG: radical SAM protein [Fervidobacterium sp.]|uniref:Radical_SAM C-terminal domain-containing protein n=1 Tax=Fervidobacterium gondwanense DSM 13020 TaxID=1121883 RepID=A0A1M7TCQ4_FERGO|nr:radical SAM protein [Fervidobacterium gondwanense]UXF01744.1 radical SAM protein [Fervidobacterium riparium]SHN68438.1 Radical_SAM C-terminal domain-containing protein [Fervidobacterium gondwanense DSM 13020]
MNRVKIANKLKIYPIFLPNLGCKTRCVYCNQSIMTGENVPKFYVLEQLLKDKNDIDEIAFYGGTFTGLPKDVMKRLLSIRPDIPKRISTRPDSIDEEILEILKSGNVKTIELGVESLDDDVLKHSKRNYTKEDVLKSIRLVQNHFEVVAHLMIGLPYDTSEKDLRTVSKLLNEGVKLFRIHPTIVFKDTELEQLYNNGEYEPLTLEDAVTIISEMTMFVESFGGVVTRLGYYVPDSQKQFIVAGPYHPSFGDLVRSSIIRMLVERYDIHQIQYNRRYKSWISAYGNSNIELDRREIEADDILLDSIPYKVFIRRFVDEFTLQKIS